jgi:hypothetical protein
MWRSKGKWLIDTIVFHSAVNGRPRDGVVESPVFPHEMPVRVLVRVSQIVAHSLTMRAWLPLSSTT